MLDKAVIDLVFIRDEETYGLRRVCLYELREDLSSWRLISAILLLCCPTEGLGFIGRK
ncbi:hypothetical protein Hanom_Chr10g00960311 [Helianthus anomalus]